MYFVFLMLVSVNVCNDKTIMFMFVTVTFMLVYSLGFTEIAAACSYVLQHPVCVPWNVCPMQKD